MRKTFDYIYKDTYTLLQDVLKECNIEFHYTENGGKFNIIIPHQELNVVILETDEEIIVEYDTE
jgi:cystathionine beta-lyase/cystathionine gamma-synthase